MSNYNTKEIFSVGELLSLYKDGELILEGKGNSTLKQILKETKYYNHRIYVMQLADKKWKVGVDYSAELLLSLFSLIMNNNLPVVKQIELKSIKFKLFIRKQR